LLDAMNRLHNIRGCVRVRLGGKDIVRHPLVQRIVDAYDDTGPEPRHD
jgi:phosphate starvation-inducible protein PhoH and related proteins